MENDHYCYWKTPAFVNTCLYYVIEVLWLGTISKEEQEEAGTGKSVD